MSLTCQQMKSLLDEIKPLLEGCRFVQCASVDEREFILTFSSSKADYHLLLCFQAPFLRFHLSRFKTAPAAEPFLQKISQTLSKNVLQTISLLNNDRILCLNFQNHRKHTQLIAEFFPKRPNCYLLDSNNHVLATLNPTEDSFYQLPAKPACTRQISAPDKPISSQAIEKFYQELKLKTQFQFEKKELHTRLEKLVKRSQKQRSNCLQSLEKCREWEKIQHEGLLLQSHLFLLKQGMPEVTLSDWMQDNQQVVIALNPQLEPQQEIAKRFQKSKKLKAGLAHDLVLLQKRESEIATYQQYLESLSAIQTREELIQFQKTVHLPATNQSIKIKSEAQKKLPMREFHTLSGAIIWVGKNAKDNEKLTFSFAKGSDWWMHVADTPGSHVILRSRKGAEPDMDSLQDALQLALCYSQAKASAEADIHVTQCKYVKRLGKGNPGKVQISKHKILHVRLDPKRLTRLKEQTKM